MLYRELSQECKCSKRQDETQHFYTPGALHEALRQGVFRKGAEEGIQVTLPNKSRVGALKTRGGQVFLSFISSTLGAVQFSPERMAFLLDLSQKKEHHGLKQDCFPHLLPSPDSLPSPQGPVLAVTRTSPAWLGKLNFISVLRKNNWRAKVITTVSLKFVALKFHSIWKSLPCIKLAKRFWQQRSGNR